LSYEHNIGEYTSFDDVSSTAEVMELERSPKVRRSSIDRHCNVDVLSGEDEAEDSICKIKNTYSKLHAINQMYEKKPIVLRVAIVINLLRLLLKIVLVPLLCSRIQFFRYFEK
jgi:hypothetical protein